MVGPMRSREQGALKVPSLPEVPTLSAGYLNLSLYDVEDPERQQVPGEHLKTLEATP